jgi:hypothetical protein
MGETCAFDDECESANCDQSACTDLCCTGTCGSPFVTVAAGGDCSAWNARCVDGTSCYYSSSTEAICVAEIPLGAACNPTDNSGHRCPMLAVCKADGAGGGSCTLPPAEGEACDTAHTVACNSELDSCDSNGNCSRRGGVGAACSDDSACLLYAYCSSGVCELLKKAGETCDRTNTAQGNCMMGMICSDNGACTSSSTSPCP